MTDAEGLADLYSREGEKVLIFLTRRTWDAEIALELTAETFAIAIGGWRRRRTLPGRTIITGVALPQVRSITLSTPTDVRTLRPSGPRHTIIAVYDGYFLRGKITATITLADGRTKTENVVSGGGLIASNPQPPSLRTQLASVERQLAEARHPSSRTHGRQYMTNDVVKIMQARIDTIKRRIAYEYLHPGLLPAE
jgi:hypothetical protein